MSIVDQIDSSRITPEEYVKLAYLTILGRKIDDVGLSSWRKRISRGKFRRQRVLDNLLGSSEYFMLQKTPFPDMVHKARQAWAATLEPFDRVLDIGGSSGNIPEGAMIELGYRHRPREIAIFDKPEDEQYWGKPKFPQDRDYEFDWGKVTYRHGYAEQIEQVESLRNEKFDCVFMGQTIEHIYPDKLPDLLRWIFSHVSDGGRFIFDTPNRLVTKIQIPKKFIDEDHKFEDTPDELARKVEAAGFRVTKRVGILHMPRSYRTKKWDPVEVWKNKLVCDDVDASYLFSLECSK